MAVAASTTGYSSLDEHFSDHPHDRVDDDDHTSEIEMASSLGRAKSTGKKRARESMTAIRRGPSTRRATTTTPLRSATSESLRGSSTAVTSVSSQVALPATSAAMRSQEAAGVAAITYDNDDISVILKRQEDFALMLDGVSRELRDMKSLLHEALSRQLSTPPSTPQSSSSSFRGAPRHPRCERDSAAAPVEPLEEELKVSQIATALRVKGSKLKVHNYMSTNGHTKLNFL
jgi:hypothetical protein